MDTIDYPYVMFHISMLSNYVLKGTYEVCNTALV